MKTVFADTGYWIAILDPQDTLNPKAIQCSISLTLATIYTSKMVLTEFLNHFAKRGKFLRQAAVNFIDSLQKTTDIAIVPQTSELYQQALELYAKRVDQGSSLESYRLCIILYYA